MLHQLSRYANDHNLAVKYGFTNDKYKWVIDLDNNGELLSLRKVDREIPLCPKYPSNLMTAGGRSHFIVETFNKIDLNYFIELIERATEVEPLFLSVAIFLRNATQKTRLQEYRDVKKAKPTEKVTFSVDGVYLVDLTSWHGWWQEHVRKESGGGASKGAEMLCLLDGMPTVAEERHYNKIKGFKDDSVLIGFDKESFRSYGLVASTNAAMSTNAMLTYTNALNYMIKKAAKPNGNVLLLHGYDKPIPQEDEIFNLFADINTGGDDAIRANAEQRLNELVDDIRQGKRSEYLHNSYYVIMVTGASRRVMVRDYFEGDCKQLADNYIAWFDDCSLVSFGGEGDANTPKLSVMLTRLVDFRKKEESDKLFNRVRVETRLSSIVPSIWRSVLTGTPLPDTIASKALNNLRSRLLNQEKTKQEKNKRHQEKNNLDTIACMWLKIWLTRGGISMTKGLNRDETSQAYHMGRLLAVYAKLQEDANKGANVGMEQRYFASASTTPALVLGRLASLSNHHLAKLCEGAAVWYKQQLQEVAGNIRTALPDVMNLKDQSLFALGYYHQMADFYKGKSPKNEEE